MSHQKEYDNIGNESKNKPWQSASSFSSERGESIVLEKFLFQIYRYLFDPKNERKYKDNISVEERQALINMSMWNRDRDNLRVIRVQDKGSRFVVDWKETYIRKSVEHIEDNSTFACNEVDPSVLNNQAVREWAQKWEERGFLDDEVQSWVTNDNPKPGNLYANIKTHKDNWPYRFIMSARNTATENLARWPEMQLKPYAMQHEAYISDTKSFLLHLVHLNEMRAPFRTKLISWDIVNYYPNCNTQMCIEAVRRVLETAQSREFLEVPVECILETLKITMTSNNGEFLKRHFTQINGATIGGPASASATDIFGAVFIDPVPREGGPLFPVDWKQYRDDTWDIKENVDEKDLVQFTEYMNTKVLEDKIRFTLEHSETELMFLDTKVHLKNGI